MSAEFKRNLEKYAEVIVKVGLNVQPGQRLLIGASLFGVGSVPLELAPLVRLIAIEAYKAGVKFVDVMWQDDSLQLIRLQHAPRGSFEECANWRYDEMLEYAKMGDAILSIYASNPDLIIDQDSESKAAIQYAVFKHNQPTMELVGQNFLNWCMISAPVDGWVEKVYPDLPADDAKIKFWETIFEICRVKVSDPITAWKNHISQLVLRCDYLNHKSYHAIQMTAPGTNLIVGLPNAHQWLSGGLTSRNGIFFVGNIPTEEVFTLPHKDRIEGVVSATKPLSYEGSIIENFTLVFSQGRIVKVKAKKGENDLMRLIETDEGASRLGEIALVPHSSPISRTGRLFYNMLIDENASSHIALGSAYKFNLKGGVLMSGREFSEEGGNNSMIHIDLMVGSGEMLVDGLFEDGASEPIMRNGEWAFQV